MLQGQSHLFGNLPECVGAIADDSPVSGKEHLSHKNTIDPQLMCGPIAMPEAAVVIARVVPESVPHPCCRNPVFLLSGVFVHKDDRVPWKEVVQCIVAKPGNIAVLIDVYVHILLN